MVFSLLWKEVIGKTDARPTSAAVFLRPAFSQAQ